MEYGPVKIDVTASTMTQNPSVGFSHVFVSLSRFFEQFIVDDGRVSSQGSYLDSTFRDSVPCLKLHSFSPDYVYQHVYDEFHDHVLSRHITDGIVDQSQRKDLPQGPLFMILLVKFTHREYIVLPPSSAPSTTTTTDSEPEICSICLENMSDSEPESSPILQLPHCAHEFHEDCFIKWSLRHSSCPLCRRPV
ncbi:unnamed protein product [Thlaspi arvense]|uniref:RING-type domain-containing protein n=1 Tax=Thlaspi arvense TaxID=13288 RepID=A0AAU9R712_THLAR|nr:unnamed protein product [Thlaspi arvense]